MGRIDNAKFLEQFRYIIVASQLLNEYSYHGQVPRGKIAIGDPQITAPQLGDLTIMGVACTAGTAFILAWLIHWARGGQTVRASTGRISLVVSIFGILITFSYTYVRRQWLQYVRRQALEETTEFTTRSQGFDAVIAAAMTLVQEVELVSRGYRM